jgi:FHA domain-containing protein
MAKLKNDQGSEFLVPCRCLIGRSGLANLRLKAPRVSAEHCMVFWENRAWYVRELGSRNGTSINGQPLTPGQPRPLQIGDSLRLAGTDEVWGLCDDEPPEPCAVCEPTGGWRHGQHGLLQLPDDGSPSSSIFEQGGRWVCEGQNQIEGVESEQTVIVNALPWKLFLPELPGVSERTEEGSLVLGTLTLRFSVSANEEHVALELLHGGLSREVPSRSYLYTLLVLARRRTRPGPNDDPEGWVHTEELARMLRCSREKLNVDIHRLRQLLRIAKVRDAGKIVERRLGSSELRIGTNRIELQEC